MEVIMETGTKKKFDWYSLIAAVVMMLIGVTILVWPDETGTVLVYVVGGVVAVAGLVRTILYFAHAEHPSPFSFGGLTVGLTLLAIGVLILSKPDLLKQILPSVLGCLLIFAGFGSLQSGIELSRLKITRWWLPLIFAALAIACGVLAIANPFGTARALMIFIGIALCAEGLLTIISLCMFKKSV